MEPGFQRGDILFLENNTEELVIGDVVVFKIKGRDTPIVHRVLSKYKRRVDGDVDVLTKGDNNKVDDRTLYVEGQSFVSPDDVVGRARL